MTGDEISAVLERMLRGEMDTAEIVATLSQIEADGVGAPQISAGVDVMRAHMVRIDVPDGAMDIVGTGGTGLKTLSISTATAIVVAACNIPVAKHGNRGASSPTGTADVLSELGVNIAMHPDRASAAIGEVGIGFLYAPAYHPALRHVAEARRQIGSRTLFNRLGPLCNPASVKNMLVGCAVRADQDSMARALAQDLDMSAWIVRGRDGLDELTTTGPSDVIVVEGGRCAPAQVSPGDVGFDPVTPKMIQGGEPAMNARALAGLLDGAPGPYREIVTLNAAAALRICGRAMAWADAKGMAEAAIDAGLAKAKLGALAEFSNG